MHTPAPASRPSPTNLLFVFPDQMRAFSQAYMARFGIEADPVRTPRLDAFARQSTTLTEAVSNYPVCCPYRAMLMTGCYPHRNGVMGNIHSGRPYELRDEDVCLTDVLADAGYDVGYIGKWHLTRPHEPFLPAEVNPDHSGGWWNEFTPPHRRHGIRWWHAYNTFDKHLDPMYWPNDADRDGYIRPGVWGPRHEADRAVEFLTQRRDPSRPFALFVSMNPPHPGFAYVPDHYREPYRGRTPEQLLTRRNVPRRPDGTIDMPKASKAVEGHFAMITGVDEQFGRILDALDEQGLADDTLVVFTSDHGEMMGSHGRMMKSVWYEESMRVPCVMRLPGSLREDAADDLRLDTPDLPATLLGLMGLGARAPQSWQGVDYAPALRGKPQARPDAQLYLANENGPRGLRTPRHAFVMRNPADPSPDSTSAWLFDREQDPGQLNNLSDQQLDLVNELTAQLRRRLAEIDDPWPSASARRVS